MGEWLGGGGEGAGGGIPPARGPGAWPPEMKKKSAVKICVLKATFMQFLCIF
jgi:hypothetical protein